MGAFALITVSLLHEWEERLVSPDEWRSDSTNHLEFFGLQSCWLALATKFLPAFDPPNEFYLLIQLRANDVIVLSIAALWTVPSLRVLSLSPTFGPLREMLWPMLQDVKRWTMVLLLLLLSIALAFSFGLSPPPYWISDRAVNALRLINEQQCIVANSTNATNASIYECEASQLASQEYLENIPQNCQTSEDDFRRGVLWGVINLFQVPLSATPLPCPAMCGRFVGAVVSPPNPSSWGMHTDGARGRRHGRHDIMCQHKTRNCGNLFVLRAVDGFPYGWPW